MADLLINDQDALSAWGVRMGDGFLDAIDTPCTMKEFVTNSSRLEHGKRIVVENPKVESREITLPFTIEGTSEADFKSKKKAFYNELYKGKVDIQIPANSSEVFHLVYLGKATSYAQNVKRTFCKFAAKFEEYNPNIRV